MQLAFVSHRLSLCPAFRSCFTCVISWCGCLSLNSANPCVPKTYWTLITASSGDKTDLYCDLFLKAQRNDDALTIVLTFCNLQVVIVVSLHVFSSHSLFLARWMKGGFVFSNKWSKKRSCPTSFFCISTLNPALSTENSYCGRVQQASGKKWHVALSILTPTIHQNPNKILKSIFVTLK